MCLKNKNADLSYAVWEQKCQVSNIDLAPDTSVPMPLERTKGTGPGHEWGGTNLASFEVKLVH